MDQRSAEPGRVGAPRASQVTEQGSGKAVSGSGRISLRLEGIRGDEAEVAGLEQQSSVLSALDHQSLRSHGEHPGCRPANVVLLGQFPELLVVDDQAVDAP